jgi:hypothetical protein
VNPFENVAGTGHAVELRNLAGRLRISEYGPMSATTVQHDATALFASDRWVCLEVELAGLPSTGSGTASTAVYIDDVVQPDLATSAELGPLAVLSFGLVDRALTEVWLDDVMVDTSRVGCAR